MPKLLRLLNVWIVKPGCIRYRSSTLPRGVSSTATSAGGGGVTASSIPSGRRCPGHRGSGCSPRRRQPRAGGRRVGRMRAVAPVDQERDERRGRTDPRIGEPPGENAAVGPLAPSVTHVAKAETGARAAAPCAPGRWPSRPSRPGGAPRACRARTTSAARARGRGIGRDQLEVLPGPETDQRVVRALAGWRPPGAARTPVHASRRATSSSRRCPPQTRWSTGGNGVGRGRRTVTLGNIGAVRAGVEPAPARSAVARMWRSMLPRISPLPAGSRASSGGTSAATRRRRSAPGSRWRVRCPAAGRHPKVP